jgi:putative redox protein
MELNSSVTWKDGMAFDAELEGFRFAIDADEQFGGRGLGPRPKGLLVTSLIGCTAMDVIAILGKMRVAPKTFEVTADAVLTDEHPKRYTRITVAYKLTGDDLPENKIRRAVQLSEERYCGVRATLAPVVEMDHEIWVNGELLSDEAERSVA